MCGESMVIIVRQRAYRIPLTGETHYREEREWTCRECDYFEEVTDEDEQPER